MGHGDTRIEDLLAHADWLRRLAASLVRDQDPDDLVQETFLRALRSPPERPGPVQPWLATVLRNLLRNRWRGVRARERAVNAATFDALAPAPAADQLLERAQLQRDLAQLVVTLEEPYRSAVLLCYYEGKSSPEIAEALHVPAGTVRWRLKEGITRLRARLDARDGGERKRWIALLTPLAGPEKSKWAPISGGTLMAATSKKIVVGALAALAVLVLAGLWLRDGRPEPPNRTLAPERVATLRARAPQLLTVEEAGALPPAAVEGVVQTPDGRPLAGALVVLTRADNDPFDTRRPTASTSSDGQGRFRFEGARPGEYLATANRFGWLPAVSAPFALAADERRQLTLRVREGGVSLQGRVLDAGGGPIAGARVTAATAQGGGPLVPWAPQKLYMATTDASGRYQLTLAPPSTCCESRRAATRASS